MMHGASPPDSREHPENVGLRAWIDAGADLADCTAPTTAEIGEYAHRLAIPGPSHPVHGERRAGLGRTWRWDAERHGWERIA